MVSDYEERIVYLRWSIKNALERGYSITAIRQSLVNAGYDQKEVELAAQDLGPLPLHAPSQVPIAKINQVKPLPKTQTAPSTQNTNIVLPDYSIPKENTEPSFRGLIIFLIIIASMMITGAAILGLYWDRLFA